ncbi:iron complex transport system substrate-binding protein [Crossiella equi]|uniref:Iron complex transport system substrate-binding protein n=1 Tax=Crossiella equi TaxID=130796 RepID=A0ABS5AL57_9PSEU|nr:ABC transporter substrate-binding protein [Crossiella equi]MBP2477320.1 iron complex transport system substrate-binding protein [Crossiella equi]
MLQRRFQAAAIALTAILAVGACASRVPDPAPSQTADSLFPVEVSVPGVKPVTIAKKPQRIVSLSPTSTESLFAFGAGKQVVAVDDQSNFPAEAPKTTLSGFKPNVEAIAGHNPDLVVASNDTEGVVAGLEKLKIPVLLLPAATTLDEAYGQIAALGQATGLGTESNDLVNKIKNDIAKLVRETPKPKSELKYFHELGQELYTVTSKTFIGQIYQQFGLVNIADGADPAGSGYPQVSAEQVVNAAPRLIFLADTKCCGQNAGTVGKRPGWDKIPAVTGGGVVALDDDIASRWGPRVVDLVRTVAEAVARTGQR